jgi:RsiW-degrading membrane proteinase PrsW (M82 family)
MAEFGSVGFAALGGLLPVLLWLWFWLREDRAHPEPKSLLLLAFLAGMVAVAIVIPLQQGVAAVVTGVTLTYALWSTIEEVVKYALARITVLWRKEVNEPIDPVIYMIVVALGFAAAENTLFLLSPLAGNTMVANIITGNLRFIGATLLHVLSSAIVGVALALTFYKPRYVRQISAVIGVILAALLHSVFNFFILNTPSEHLLRTFAGVWVGVVALLAMIEIVKRLHRRRYK